jgi:hypothetical protein
MMLEEGGGLLAFFFVHICIVRELLSGENKKLDGNIPGGWRLGFPSTLILRGISGWLVVELF